MTPNRLPVLTAWLFLSLASGCLLTWFWCSGNKLDVFLSGAWVWPYLLPAALCALGLPVLGAAMDLSQRNGFGAVIATVASALLLVFGGADGLQEFGLAPLWTAVFLIHLTLHQGCLGLVKASPFQAATGMALTVAVFTLGWFAYGLAPTWPWRTLLVLGALLGALLFALLVLPNEGAAEMPSWQGIEERLRTSFGGEQDPANIRFLYVYIAVVAAAATQAQTNILFSLDLGTFKQLSILPFCFLVPLWMGLTSAGAVGRTYGFRRTQMVLLCLLGLCLVGLILSNSVLERSLLLGVIGFAFGLVTALAATQLCGYGPAGRSGQTAGLVIAVLILGVVASRLFGLVLTEGSVAGSVMLFLLAAVLAQKLPVGCPSLAESLEPSPENPREVEWDWGDTPATGLACHTVWTRGVNLLARTLTELFFGRLRIVGREKLVQIRSNGAIYVANHPNTFFDPLLITALAPGRLHYWAKSTLWKMPLAGSILDRVGALPVYRQRDAEANVQGGNDQTMSVAADKINQGALMLIFPEGVSEPGLSLKPVKTGAARLAFTAMEGRQWRSELVIVPIAIDYSEPSLFRGGVTLRIGDPVTLSAYQEHWATQPREAVRVVTDEVRARLTALLPHLEAPDQETLVRQIHDLYGEQLLQILGETDETAARKAIANAVNHYHALDPDTLVLFRQRVDAYEREKERLGTPENHPPIPLTDLLRIFKELFSLASFGLLLNWIPYRLTGKLVEMWVTAPVWIATAKLGFGMLTFGIYYALVGLVLSLTVGVFPMCIFLGLMAFSACLALGAMERFAFRFRQLRTLWQAFWTQDTDEDLEEMKVSLLQDLERFRESYAFYQEHE